MDSVFGISGGKLLTKWSNWTMPGFAGSPDANARGWLVTDRTIGYEQQPGLTLGVRAVPGRIAPNLQRSPEPRIVIAQRMAAGPNGVLVFFMDAGRVGSRDKDVTPGFDSDSDSDSDFGFVGFREPEQSPLELKQKSGSRARRAVRQIAGRINKQCGGAMGSLGGFRRLIHTVSNGGRRPKRMGGISAGDRFQSESV